MAYPRIPSALAALMALGCGGGSDYDDTPDSDTLIAVDPVDFAAELACGEPSGLESYVGRLVDVTPYLASNGEELSEYPVQSSPPTLCNRSLAFGLVTEERSYVVDIDGYPDLDGDPEHLDVCTVPGSSVVQSLADGECTGPYLEPSWQYRCYGWEAEAADPSDADGSAEGEGQPGVSLEYRTVFLHYCLPRPME